MSERKIQEIDTFAQWEQTDYFIDTNVPTEGVTLVGINTTSDRVENDKEYMRTKLLFKSLDYETSGNLHQMVPVGSEMESVTVNVAQNNYKKCFPIDWVKNETRISGIQMVGDSPNGTSLGFSGTPTSSDTINMPQLVNKFVISLPADLSRKHYNWDISVQESDKYFLNSMRVTVTADEGYRFAPNMDYTDVTITPRTMEQYMSMTRASDSKLQFDLKDRAKLDLTKLSDVEIDIPACEKATYRVAIALGPNMTASGGELLQHVIIGQPMTQINLVATNGMTFFPSIQINISSHPTITIPSYKYSIFMSRIIYTSYFTSSIHFNIIYSLSTICIEMNCCCNIFINSCISFITSNSMFSKLRIPPFKYIMSIWCYYWYFSIRYSLTIISIHNSTTINFTIRSWIKSNIKMSSFSPLSK